jgi:hypothetical protein
VVAVAVTQVLKHLLLVVQAAAEHLLLLDKLILVSLVLQI